MPRVYDYSNNSELSDQDEIFSVYRRRREGTGEVSIKSLWGPHGFFRSGGPHHQFMLRAINEQSPYDNDLVDPVFDWLCENANGGWHWHESEVNHGHSVVTEVYIADIHESDAFREKWHALFEHDEKVTARNEKLKARAEEARANNALPSHVTVEMLKYVLASMDAEVGEFLDTLSDRHDFAATFSQAFDATVGYMLEEDKPSQYGPRMLDGNWHEGVTGAFHEIGAWVRTSAPESLREELLSREIADEGLYEAFRSGVEDQALVRTVFPAL